MKTTSLFSGKKAIVMLILVIGFVFVIVATDSSKDSINDENNHIHAIAFDPTDSSTLYVGTHYVLEKIVGSQKEYVGAYGDDFMGFVIASDGSFYSSGHSPEVADVGIRKSIDKGKTWTTLAYEGEDFHNMATSYADPKIVYAWSTPPTEFLTLTKDGGRNWEIIDLPTFNKSVFALAADHQAPNKVYAGTLTGLQVSEDYGMRWHETSSLANVPVFVVADDPGNAGVMYVSAYGKGLLKTIDDGVTWTGLNTGLPEYGKNPVVFLAINPHNTTELYAVTKHGDVYLFESNRWQQITFA